MMNLLAIDPGPVQSAWVMWDGERIWRMGISSNEELLDTIRLHAISDDPRIAIEMIASFGMPVGKTVFETCIWIGRFIEASGMKVTLIPRKEICVHVCASARARDANIRQALIDRLGAPGTKKNPGPTYGVSKDIWSALAVAIVAADRLQIAWDTSEVA